MGSLNAIGKRAGICALFCLALATPAFANVLTDDNIAVYESMDEALRVKSLIDLAKAGEADAAEELLQRYPLSSDHAANRTLYIEGLILKARQDYKGAAEKFRAALADDPSLTVVRSELAQVLVITGQDDSAKHHLELLAGDAPNTKAAQGVRSFLDAMDTKKPYSFSGYIDIAPSTNINSGSGADKVYSNLFGGEIAIDEESKKKSGATISGGVNGSYNKRLGEDFLFVAAGGMGANLRAIFDDEADLEFQSLSFSQSLELRYMFDQGSIGIGAVASQAVADLSDPGINYLAYGPRLSLRLNASPVDTFTASSTYEFRDFNVDGTHDASAWTSDFAWSHAFAKATSMTLYGGIDVIENPLKYNSYTTVSGGLQVYKELSHGISVTTAAEIRKSQFAALNPQAGATREDTRLMGGVTFTKRDLNILGFAPALNYTYVWNGSNISLYDYDSHSIDFRLTKDF